MRRLLTALIVIFACLLLVEPALAYESYSTVKSNTTPDDPPNYNGCRSCHGNFRQNPYVEPGTGVSWGDDAHDVHRNTMLSGDCNTCHSSGGNHPVRLGSSQGGVNLDAISCAGCHGKLEDAVNPAQVPIANAEGMGASLRQMHWRVNETVDVNGDGTVMVSTRVCGDCHQRSDLGGITDANPTNFTPVGEDLLPPYYDDPDGGPSVHTGIPADSCDSTEEDIAGTARGLDNDGDRTYDESDVDCGAVVAAPGETSGPTLALLEVTAVDLGASTLDVAYGVPCVASDQAFVFGSLSQVSTYGYSGADCNVGNTGAYTFDFSALPDDLFFLVVGHNGTVEGSYGTGGAAAERLSDDLLMPPVCPFPQDLPNRCDP
jgi:hypothetical protein